MIRGGFKLGIDTIRRDRRTRRERLGSLVAVVTMSPLVSSELRYEVGSISCGPWVGRVVGIWCGGFPGSGPSGGLTLQVRDY